MGGRDWSVEGDGSIVEADVQNVLMKKDGEKFKWLYYMHRAARAYFDWPVTILQRITACWIAQE